MRQLSVPQKISPLGMIWEVNYFFSDVLTDVLPLVNLQWIVLRLSDINGMSLISIWNSKWRAKHPINVSSNERAFVFSQRSRWNTCQRIYLMNFHHQSSDYYTAFIYWYSVPQKIFPPIEHNCTKLSNWAVASLYHSNLSDKGNGLIVV